MACVGRRLKFARLGVGSVGGRLLCDRRVLSKKDKLVNIMKHACSIHNSDMKDSHECSHSDIAFF